MLILTGILLGGVLVVTVGGSAHDLQETRWITTTTLPLPIPAWVGPWFSVFPTLESHVAQALAIVIILGSYVLAEYVRVARPRRPRERASHPAKSTLSLDSAREN